MNSGAAAKANAGVTPLPPTGCSGFPLKLGNEHPALFGTNIAERLQSPVSSFVVLSATIKIPSTASASRLDSQRPRSLLLHSHLVGNVLIQANAVR